MFNAASTDTGVLHRLRHCAPSQAGKAKGMIDNFALGLTHGLMMLAALLLLRRPDLDREAPARPEEPPVA
ncbi:MAG: hypothetical protein B7Y47_03140 [Sphingomonas sp. 28-63-12]|nr:MAG: hypothetical protein B7Y47_03140 [Sphingomonas sp. 28-63-12]